MSDNLIHTALVHGGNMFCYQHRTAVDELHLWPCSCWCNADLRAIAEFTSSCGTSVGIMFSDYMLNFGSPILGLGYAGVYSSSPTGLIMCWMQNIRIVRTSRRVAVLALTVPQRLKHSLCLDTIDHNRARQVASRNFAEEQRNRFSAVWADFRV